MNIEWTYANASAFGYEYWAMRVGWGIDPKAVIYRNEPARRRLYEEPEWEVHCDFISDRALPAPITNAEEAKQYVEALYRLEGS